MNPKEFASAALASVQQEMKDLDEVVRLCFVALYTNGHVLLEGNPGLGKTALVRALSDTLGFSKGRIQFTPDLMPADITGTYMPTPHDGMMMLEFVPGPINTSLLLADEINRATPKTQSAMLEAMAERQVTVLGKSLKLPQPFMVLATQNPIDHEGTYTLPEAQLDRFMFKIFMPVPAGMTLRAIMQKEAGKVLSKTEEKVIHSVNSLEVQRHHQYYESIRAQEVLECVEDHIVNIILASNRQFNELKALNSLDAIQRQKVTEFASELFKYGLGPRAAKDLMLGAKAWSFFFSDPIQEKVDGIDLAHVVLPTLRHRFKLTFDWPETYQKNFRRTQKRGTDDDNLLDELIADFCIMTAPSKQHGYNKAFEQTLELVLSRKHGGA